MKLVADVKQLMQFVLDPAANVYGEGVGSICRPVGCHRLKLETQGEWDALVHNFFLLIESACC